MRDWNVMPHRKYSLQQLAVNVLVINSTIEREFARIRPFWATQLGQSPDNESLELLIARFDPANYRRTPQADGSVLVEFEWPIALKAKTDAARQESELHLLLLGFPASCRRILDEGRAVDSADLPQLIVDLTRILDLKSEDVAPELVGNRVAAVLGGATVLFLYHRDRVRQDSAFESRLLNIIKAAIEVPPVGGEFDIAESMLPYRWDCFSGELLSVLLTEKPNEEWVRKSYADSMMAFHYDATRIAANAAYRLRCRLGDDWPRTQNLLVMWAGLRCCLARAKVLKADIYRYLAWRDRLCEAFVARRIRTEALKWTRIGSIGQVVLSRIEATCEELRWFRNDDLTASSAQRRKRRRREHPGLDAQVLQSAFDWIPLLSEAATKAERSHFIALVENALNVTLGMLPSLPSPDDGIEGTPYQYDNWVFKKTAMCIAQMTAEEDSKRLWKPIFDLGGGAHYWISAFISDWLISGIRVAPSPQHFAERWGEMIDYALTAPAWTSETGRQKHRIADLISELMGLSWNGQAVRDVAFSAEVEAQIARFQRFADRWLRWPHVASRFARFLSKASARRLLPEGVKWLRTAVVKFDIYSWRQDDLEDSILEAVRACWFECSARLQKDMQLRQAFLELLDILNRRQNAAAFELRDEVARSLPRA